MIKFKDREFDVYLDCDNLLSIYIHGKKLWEIIT